MARKIYVHEKRKPLFPQMMQRLVEELKKDSNEKFDLNDQVLIREDRTAYDTLHVVVAWDEWKALTKEERGRVIVDAYEEAFDEEFAHKITVAMGLTKAEAKEIDIEF